MDNPLHEALFELGEQGGDADSTQSAGDGTQALIELGVMMEYADHQRDDDPLYIFDATFDALAPDLLDHYSVPSYIQPCDPLACLEAPALNSDDDDDADADSSAPNGSRQRSDAFKEGSAIPNARIAIRES